MIGIERERTHTRTAMSKRENVSEMMVSIEKTCCGKENAWFVHNINYNLLKYFIT